MKIRELEADQVVRYRVGRAGRDRYEWEEWQTGPLHVQKRAVTSKLGGKTYPAGEVVVLTPRNHVTADYGERDYVGGGIFMVEDYVFQIDGLEDNEPNQQEET